MLIDARACDARTSALAYACDLPGWKLWLRRPRCSRTCACSVSSWLMHVLHIVCRHILISLNTGWLAESHRTHWRRAAVSNMRHSTTIPVTIMSTQSRAAVQIVLPHALCVRWCCAGCAAWRYNRIDLPFLWAPSCVRILLCISSIGKGHERARKMQTTWTICTFIYSADDRFVYLNVFKWQLRELWRLLFYTS